MKPSAGCYALVKGFERFRPTAYRDIRGIWTIGWGHTKDVKEADTCTWDQGLTFLEQDMSEAAAFVTTRVRFPMTQNQFDALVSLVFNIGDGNFEKSQVLRALNAGSVDIAAAGFLHFTRAGRDKNALRPRREKEQALFLQA